MSDKRKPVTHSIGQLSNEVKSIKLEVSQLKITVNKLKNILQVQDNWHSHISAWIGKDVEVFDSRGSIPVTGILLWTDRYNIGMKIGGREEIFNKGQIVKVRQL